MISEWVHSRHVADEMVRNDSVTVGKELLFELFYNLSMNLIIILEA